jgi:hypothetical protein
MSEAGESSGDLASTLGIVVACGAVLALCALRRFLLHRRGLVGGLLSRCGGTSPDDGAAVLVVLLDEESPGVDYVQATRDRAVASADVRFMHWHSAVGGAHFRPRGDIWERHVLLLTRRRCSLFDGWDATLRGSRETGVLTTHDSDGEWSAVVPARAAARKRDARLTLPNPWCASADAPTALRALDVWSEVADQVADQVADLALADALIAGGVRIVSEQSPNMVTREWRAPGPLAADEVRDLRAHAITQSRNGAARRNGQRSGSLYATGGQLHLVRRALAPA